MPRKKLPFPDYMQATEDARALLHPVDYYDLIRGTLNGRIQRSPEDVDRLRDIEADVREQIFRLDPAELIGSDNRAVVVPSFRGAVIETVPMPFLESITEILTPGEWFLILDVDTTGPHWRNGDRLNGLSIVDCLMHGGVPQSPGLPRRPAGPSVSLGEIDTLDVSVAGPKEGKFAGALDWIRERLADRSVPVVMPDAARVLGFLDSESKRIGEDLQPPTRRLDMFAVSARLWPHQPASLDAICERLAVPPHCDPTERNLSWRRVEQAARCLHGLRDAAFDVRLDEEDRAHAAALEARKAQRRRKK